MTRYVIEYLDQNGDQIDGWSYNTPAGVQTALANLVARDIVVHDDDPDRAPDQPEFVAGSLVWYMEEGQ